MSSLSPMLSLSRRTLAALTLLLLASAPAPAQRDTDSSLPSGSFEIFGQVRSADGRATVANALVRLVRFGGDLVEQAATDGTGRFRFSRLRPGQYVVTVKTEGFSASSSQLDISRNIPRQHVILQLAPEAETFKRKDAPPAAVDARVPEAARREFEGARNALHAGRAEEAARRLDRAVELYPDFFEAHALLGQTRMELKAWGEAERSLRRAHELRPRDTTVLIYLGETCRRQKKLAEAERALVAALKLDRGSWQGHFTLGRVYWEGGDAQKAAPHVGQALEIKPDYPEAHLLAGNIFVRLQMPQHALVEYEEYLRLAPAGEFARQTEENVKKLRKALAEKK